MSKKRLAFWGVFLVLGLMSAAGCKSGGSPGSPSQPTPDVTLKDDPSFAADIQSIFNASCSLAGCHNASASGGLVLLQGQAYINLVNVVSAGEPPKVRVIPNDAGNSYLVIKLENRQSFGSRMPQGASALSANRIQNIKNWINKGARDN